MNDRQRDYFRAKLLAWKDEILRESRITLQTLQEENVNHPDLADRASSETDRAIELRARDRQRKLISKIDAALQRIEDNTYGYCEEIGSPGLAEFCAREKSRLAADVLIASDGPRLSAARPTLYLGSRGAINFDFSVHLRDGAHHSGTEAARLGKNNSHKSPSTLLWPPPVQRNNRHFPASE